MGIVERVENFRNKMTQLNNTIRAEMAEIVGEVTRMNDSLASLMVQLNEKKAEIDAYNTQVCFSIELLFWVLLISWSVGQNC